MTLGRTRSARGNNQDRNRNERQQDNTQETVVDIRRVAKTVAGGRNFTFNALVVVGDGNGNVGFGLGRAKEVPDAVQKGTSNARRAMVNVKIIENTVPQKVVSRYGGAQIMLKPAAPGTGIRASAAVRAVVQAAGVKDIATKSQGSSNSINVVRATMKGLLMMRDPREQISIRRVVRGELPLPELVKESNTEINSEGKPPEENVDAVAAKPPEENVDVVAAKPPEENVDAVAAKPPEENVDAVAAKPPEDESAEAKSENVSSSETNKPPKTEGSITNDES